MEQKNKSILAVSIIVLVILALVLVAIVMKNNKKKVTAPPSVSPKIEKSIEELIPQVTEEKKAEVAVTRNIIGKITAIKIDSISVTPAAGEKLTLKVPQKGANFSSLTKQKDGSFMVKEIGLFDIPQNKDVEIQYNSQKMEVMMVSVK